MELGGNIRMYRSALGWSQETLAEKAYVSRQTVSNWENEKSYPDVHSLIILSELFSVSIDELIKGDVEIMKNSIKDENIRVFRRWSNIYAVMFFVAILSPILWFKLGVIGVVIFAVFWIITMLVAFKLEKLKKEYNIETYQEIVAFLNGETLDEIRAKRESKNALYQKILFAVCSALIGLVISVLLAYLIK